LRLLRQNPGKRPINTKEPHPDALDDAIPDVLVDPVARAEWTRAIVPAIRIGHVTSADNALAIAHCSLWATWVAQIAAAAGTPSVQEVGPHRYPRPNPLHVLPTKTMALLIGVDERLGFSPTSRSRVQVKGPGSTRAVMDKQRARFFDSTRG
jgi:phage terminase small subunit